MLEWKSEDEEALEEGCLSLPSVLVDVDRPIHVRVRAQDEYGEPILIEASGLEARVIQHEMDHLDGVLILDRTSRDQRKQAMRTLREEAQGRAARRGLSQGRRATGCGRSTSAPRTSRRSVLERLAGSPHRPALVVTRPDARRGRGQKVGPPPVAERARALGIEVIQPPDLHAPDAIAAIAARCARGARRLRLRRADQGAAALGLPDLQRAPVAAPALARGGAGRAGDHGR